jgi:two-component system, sensor histidine kinase and response regulator
MKGASNALEAYMHTVRVLLIDAGEAPPMHPCVSGGRREQYRFTRKATLSAGLEALRESSFHLVLVNLSLPDASASESVAKTQQVAQEVPVIALVNEGETGKVVEAMQTGTIDFVLKGCRCDCLMRTMQHAIERKQLLAEKEDIQQRLAHNNKQLTAHLSHEIRNALACIHQFGNILVDGLAGEMSSEQREYLGIMLENGSRIRIVLDSLLESDTRLIKETAHTI